MLDETSDRFVRERECKERTGLSRTTRWRLAQAGKFPKPVQLSENIVAWRLSAILNWMETMAPAAGNATATRPPEQEQRRARASTSDAAKAADTPMSSNAGGRP